MSRPNTVQFVASAVLDAADMDIKTRSYVEKDTASKRQEMAGSGKKRIAIGALSQESHRKRI